MKSPFGYYGASVMVTTYRNNTLCIVMVVNKDGELEMPGGKWEMKDGTYLDITTKDGAMMSLANCAHRELSEEAGIHIPSAQLNNCKHIDLFRFRNPEFRLYLYYSNRINIITDETEHDIKYVGFQDFMNDVCSKQFTTVKTVDGINYNASTRIQSIVKPRRARRAIKAFYNAINCKPSGVMETLKLFPPHNVNNDKTDPIDDIVNRLGGLWI